MIIKSLQTLLWCYLPVTLLLFVFHVKHHNFTFMEDARWEKWDADKRRALVALSNAHGIVSQAAANSGVSRSTIYRYMEDEAFKAEVDLIRDEMVDHVEHKLVTLIDSGDTAATIFFMKTRGRKRGYQERQEIDHTSAGEQIAGFIYTPPKAQETSE